MWHMIRMPLVCTSHAKFRKMTCKHGHQRQQLPEITSRADSLPNNEVVYVPSEPGKESFRSMCTKNPLNWNLHTWAEVPLNGDIRGASLCMVTKQTECNTLIDGAQECSAKKSSQCKETWCVFHATLSIILFSHLSLAAAVPRATTTTTWPWAAVVEPQRASRPPCSTFM